MRSTRYANITSTLALIFALGAFCLGGAVAANEIINSGEIQNGTIKSVDLAKNSVRAPDVRAGAIQTSELGDGSIRTADIGSGEVGPGNLELPAPSQIQQAAGSVAETQVGAEFALVNSVGSYEKKDAASALEVTWTGTASAGFSPCVFQLRVDGQAASPGAGEIYVANSSTPSVSAAALFVGLGTGPHSVQVWARSTQAGTFPCSVAPAFTQVSSTFIVSEIVV